MDAKAESFETVRERLNEIVDEVSAEGISLDEALALYEEAVKLGLSACDLSEQDALEAIADDVDQQQRTSTEPTDGVRAETQAPSANED